jgi:hypothetical protein
MPDLEKVDVNDQYREKYGFHDVEKPVFKSRRGLDREIVTQISQLKGEPQWMTDFRLRALEIFQKKPMPESLKSDIRDTQEELVRLQATVAERKQDITAISARFEDEKKRYLSLGGRR